jgi:hypothetical protein
MEDIIQIDIQRMTVLSYSSKTKDVSKTLVAVSSKRQN